MHARTLARSEILYHFLDQSGGFYLNSIQPSYRSRINVTFRIKNDSKLEDDFIRQATDAGFIGLKGHAWVGVGCRVTMNNAQTFEAVFALIDFMRDF